MKDPTAALIWRKPGRDWQQQLATCVREAAAYSSASTRVFFRADDVAVPGRQFGQMVRLFVRHDIPLNLAVVPAWLTRKRWRMLTEETREAAHLWCWHQHGWRHHNHEPRGKKQEFGAARPLSALRHDLDRGRRRLEMLMGEHFFPVFTPPWNRCSAQALDYLYQNGYRAVSRSRGSWPVCPPGLAELSIDVDLHTRQDRHRETGWRAFLEDLLRGLTRPTCGFMLHHQRMNQNALAGLDLLLALLNGYKRFVLEDFRRLCEP